MIADDHDEWATRLETIALPTNVIAAEARLLANKARTEATIATSLDNAANALRDARSDTNEDQE